MQPEAPMMPSFADGGQDINISRLTPGFYVALLQDQYGNRISRKIIIE
jgi:hypothetical protein